MTTSLENGPTTVATSDGETLSAIVERPPGVVRGLAAVAHPHPLYGGDSSNPVVVALAAGLRDAGVATMRFDFRGVGRSTGTHGEGPPERLDVAAALDHLAALAPALPLVVAGYSFGADVSLTVTRDEIVGWIVVAPPLRLFPLAEMAAGTDSRPTVLLVPEHDQFCGPDAALERTYGWMATEQHVIPMADHFAVGAGTHIRALAAEVADRLMGAR